MKIIDVGSVEKIEWVQNHEIWEEIKCGWEWSIPSQIGCVISSTGCRKWNGVGNEIYKQLHKT